MGGVMKKISMFFLAAMGTLPLLCEASAPSLNLEAAMDVVGVTSVGQRTGLQSIVTHEAYGLISSQSDLEDILSKFMTKHPSGTWHKGQALELFSKFILDVHASAIKAAGFVEETLHALVASPAEYSTWNKAQIKEKPTEGWDYFVELQKKVGSLSKSSAGARATLGAASIEEKAAQDAINAADAQLGSLNDAYMVWQKPQQFADAHGLKRLPGENAQSLVDRYVSHRNEKAAGEAPGKKGFTQSKSYSDKLAEAQRLQDAMNKLAVEDGRSVEERKAALEDEIRAQKDKAIASLGAVKSRIESHKETGIVGGVLTHASALEEAVAEQRAIILGQLRFLSKNGITAEDMLAQGFTATELSKAGISLPDTSDASDAVAAAGGAVGGANISVVASPTSDAATSVSAKRNSPSWMFWKKS